MFKSFDSEKDIEVVLKSKLTIFRHILEVTGINKCKKLARSLIHIMPISFTNKGWNEKVLKWGHFKSIFKTRLSKKCARQKTVNKNKNCTIYVEEGG